MKTFCIVLIAFLSATSTASAQGIKGTWRHFHNTTSPRAMVADGPYLWIATDAGLVKFDRRIDSVVVFYTTDNSAIPANDVWKLALDTSHALWVSTRSGGLAKFQNNTWTLFNASNTPLPGPDGGIIAVDSLNRLWVATGNGLFKYDGTTWTKYDSLNSPMASNSVEALAADQQGNIWVGTSYNLTSIDRGYILKFDGASNWEVHNDTLDGHWMYDTTFDTGTHAIKMIDTTLAHELDPDNPWCMTVDHTGALWIGFSEIINQQIPGIGWQTYWDFATNNVTYDLEQDTAGMMWGGDAYGIIWIDSVLHQQQRHPFFGDCSVIPLGDSLWIAGNGGGGIAFGKDTAWKIYNKFSNCPFENDQVYAMTVDSKGRDWIGMRYYHMLYMYDGSTWKVYDSLVHGTSGVLAMCADSSGNIYVGSGGDGITKFDGHTATLIDLHKVDSFSNVIYSLMWDKRRQALWVGNGWEGSSGYHSGIARFDGVNWKTWTSPDISQQVWAMTLDTADNVWAGCYSIAGIFEFMTGTDVWQHSMALNASYTNTLSADAKGGVWAATENGPYYWDGTKWTLASDPQIVPYAAATEIDARGNVWLGGNGTGASSFDGKSWTAFTTSNSNIGTEDIWTGMADRSGNVWFGTAGQGLVEFVPDAPASVSQISSRIPEPACYPNPASASVTLRYSLAGQSSVTITVFDALGRVVACPVVVEMESAGEHEASFATNSLPPGIYSCRLTAGGREMFAKLVVAR